MGDVEGAKERSKGAHSVRSRALCGLSHPPEETRTVEGAVGWGYFCLRLTAYHVEVRCLTATVSFGIDYMYRNLAHRSDGYF